MCSTGTFLHVLSNRNLSRSIGSVPMGYLETRYCESNASRESCFTLIWPPYSCLEEVAALSSRLRRDSLFIVGMRGRQAAVTSQGTKSSGQPVPAAAGSYSTRRTACASDPPLRSRRLYPLPACVPLAPRPSALLRARDVGRLLQHDELVVRLPHELHRLVGRVELVLGGLAVGRGAVEAAAPADEHALPRLEQLRAQVVEGGAHAEHRVARAARRHAEDLRGAEDGDLPHQVRAEQRDERLPRRRAVGGGGERGGGDAVALEGDDLDVVVHGHAARRLLQRGGVDAQRARVRLEDAAGVDGEELRDDGQRRRRRRPAGVRDAARLDAHLLQQQRDRDDLRVGLVVGLAPRVVAEDEGAARLVDGQLRQRGVAQRRADDVVHRREVGQQRRGAALVEDDAVEEERLGAPLHLEQREEEDLGARGEPRVERAQQAAERAVPAEDHHAARRHLVAREGRVAAVEGVVVAVEERGVDVVHHRRRLAREARRALEQTRRRRRLRLRARRRRLERVEAAAAARRDDGGALGFGEARLVLGDHDELVVRGDASGRSRREDEALAPAALAQEADDDHRGEAALQLVEGGGGVRARGDGLQLVAVEVDQVRRDQPHEWLEREEGERVGGDGVHLDGEHAEVLGHAGADAADARDGEGVLAERELRDDRGGGGEGVRLGERVDREEARDQLDVAEHRRRVLLVAAHHEDGARRLDRDAHQRVEVDGRGVPEVDAHFRPARAPPRVGDVEGVAHAVLLELSHHDDRAAALLGLRQLVGELAQQEDRLAGPAHHHIVVVVDEAVAVGSNARPRHADELDDHPKDDQRPDEAEGGDEHAEEEHPRRLRREDAALRGDRDEQTPREPQHVAVAAARFAPRATHVMQPERAEADDEEGEEEQHEGEAVVRAQDVVAHVLCGRPRQHARGEDQALVGNFALRCVGAYEPTVRLGAGDERLGGDGVERGVVRYGLALRGGTRGATRLRLLERHLYVARVHREET
mmetsp:Transcript_14078/g.21057  ORF Transcript_14078/g.21057 Transcript_14078/m.21057 type:complete len:988 (-) Transcript_14078:13-2976(-)